MQICERLLFYYYYLWRCICSNRTTVPSLPQKCASFYNELEDELFYSRGQGIR